MKLNKYTKKGNDDYHFESSHSYCDIEVINKVFESIINNNYLNEIQNEQLIKIVDLEKLRYSLAQNEITLEEYQSKVKQIVQDFYDNIGFHIFSDTKVSKLFYEKLNKDYCNE